MHAREPETKLPEVHTTDLATSRVLPTACQIPHCSLASSRTPWYPPSLAGTATAPQCLAVHVAPVPMHFAPPAFSPVSCSPQAGCHAPRAIREHLQQHRGVAVSRQHLTAYLARQAAEGRLAKPSYGRYELPSTPYKRPSGSTTSEQRRTSGAGRDRSAGKAA